MDNTDRSARHRDPNARTLRHRLLTLPGRLTRSGRRVTLRMPAGCTAVLTALTRLRAMPALPNHPLVTDEHARRATSSASLPDPADRAGRDGLNRPISPVEPSSAARDQPRRANRAQPATNDSYPTNLSCAAVDRG